MVFELVALTVTVQAVSSVNGQGQSKVESKVLSVAFSMAYQTVDQMDDQQVVKKVFQMAVQTVDLKVVETETRMADSQDKMMVVWMVVMRVVQTVFQSVELSDLLKVVAMDF